MVIALLLLLCLDEPGAGFPVTPTPQVFERAAFDPSDPRAALVETLRTEMELIGAMARAHVSLAEISRIIDRLTRIELELAALMPTPLVTASPTAGPSSTATSTPAPLPTLTPPSVTPTRTPDSPTASSTPTRTGTATRTPTPRATATVTRTPLPTNTLAPIQWPTLRPTPIRVP